MAKRVRVPMARKFGTRAARRVTAQEVAGAIARIYNAGFRGYAGCDRIVEEMGYELPKDIPTLFTARLWLYKRLKGELVADTMNHLSLLAPELHKTLCERYTGRLPVHWGSRYCLWTIYLPEEEK